MLGWSYRCWAHGMSVSTARLSHSGFSLSLARSLSLSLADIDGDARVSVSLFLLSDPMLGFLSLYPQLGALQCLNGISGVGQHPMLGFAVSDSITRFTHTIE